MIKNGNLLRVFLIAVPFLSAVLGFGIGHVSPVLYVPLWFVAFCLMIAAVFALGKPIRKTGQGQQHFLSLLMIIFPWMLFSIFGGMGAPPDTAETFAAAANEQEVRYAILVLGGIFTMVGFGLLSSQLQNAGEILYSAIGKILIIAGILLFLLNMIYWGSFLTEAFKTFARSADSERPDWYAPVRSFFAMVSRVEVSLIYAATIAFSAALKKAGWLTTRACNMYIIVSLFAIVFNLLPESVPAPLAIPAYLVAIPAIPFIMLYLIGVNLLASRRELKVIESNQFL